MLTTTEKRFVTKPAVVSRQKARHQGVLLHLGRTKVEDKETAKRMMWVAQMQAVQEGDKAAFAELFGYFARVKSFLMKSGAATMWQKNAPKT